MTKYLTTLIIREMQIKVTMRYYLTPVRTEIIKKTKDKCCQESEGKGTFSHCQWKYKSAHSLWKTVWRFLKILKIKNRATVSSSSPTTGPIFKADEIGMLKRELHSHGFCDTIHNIQETKRP
jgi:hypothetical protein